MVTLKPVVPDAGQSRGANHGHRLLAGHFENPVAPMPATRVQNAEPKV